MLNIQNDWKRAVNGGTPWSRAYQHDVTIKRVMERSIRLWAGKQYRERGDNFATLPELKSICSDPLGWLPLLHGYDAAAFVDTALDYRSY